VLAKRLTRMHVGQMQFDKRDGHTGQGITQGDAGMREGTGIDQDAGDLLTARRVNALDQHMLGVTLQTMQAMPGDGGQGRQFGLDVGQGRVAIDFGLARAEQSSRVPS